MDKFNLIKQKIVRVKQEQQYTNNCHFQIKRNTKFIFWYTQP